jgi:hypothetical protein
VKLMRAGDVPADRGVNDRLYRYAPRVLVVWVSALLAAGIALVATGYVQHAWVPYYLAALIAGGLLFFRRYIRARFLPTNWLVRMTDSGVFIQLRSYLNWHFPTDDLTVAFVPFNEIESVGLIRERRTVLQTDDDVVVRRRKLVEFTLRADTRAVARVLADELLREPPREARWYGSTGTKFKHYPVSLASPSQLRLVWEVVPEAEAFLRALPAHLVRQWATEESHNYSALDRLSRSEQEDRLLELASNGEDIEATTLARRLYGYSFTEACQFIASLQGGKRRAAGDAR